MIEQAVATILACVITGIASTVVAIINSNSQRKVTEQKINDTLEAVQKEYDSIKGTFRSMGSRLDELSETDSCCIKLQDDVKEIKENINLMSATLNQFKANSDEFDSRLEAGFVALASDSIEQAHRYYMSKGYITESSKKSVHAVYDSYKEFGGNGYESANMNELDRLPVRN